MKEVQFFKEAVLQIKISRDDECALLFYDNKVVMIRKFEVVKTFDRFREAEFHGENLVLSDHQLI